MHAWRWAARALWGRPARALLGPPAHQPYFSAPVVQELLAFAERDKLPQVQDFLQSLNERDLAALLSEADVQHLPPGVHGLLLSCCVRKGLLQLATEVWTAVAQAKVPLTPSEYRKAIQVCTPFVTMLVSRTRLCKC